MMWLDRFLYKAYKAAYPLALKRRGKFTRGASVLLGLIGLAAAFGMNSYRSTVYQFFALVLTFFIVAFVSSFFFRGRFSVQRSLPRMVTSGEIFSYPVRIENLTDITQSSLLYQEVPLTRYPDFTEFYHAREPGESKRNWWDRTVRAYRFNWLMKRQDESVCECARRDARRRQAGY